MGWVGELRRGQFPMIAAEQPGFVVLLSLTFLFFTYFFNLLNGRNTAHRECLIEEC